MTQDLSDTKVVDGRSVMKKPHYIQDLIAQGEHEHQDFKYQITDARKIARSIAAFANHSGGHLLIGVKDNGHIAGVNSDEEIYMVEQAASMYCHPEQHVKFRVYRVDGKSVVKADIEQAQHKPVLAQDDHGQWQAYYRVADENIVASQLHIKLLKEESLDSPRDTTIQYSERERLILDYLAHHGGMTIDGFMKLAHITRATAEDTVLALCRVDVLTVQYHAQQCLIVLKRPVGQ